MPPIHRGYEDSLDQDSRLVSADDFRGAPTRIRIEGADRIRATLRAVPGDRRRPAVLHLLNRDYELASDSCRPKSGFSVRLPRALCDGRAIGRAELVAPPRWAPKTTGADVRPLEQVASVPLEVSADKDFVAIRVPRLDCWGIVVLRQ